MEWVLLPSPLLGPAVWSPVAERLRRRGHKVTVPAYADEQTPAEVLASLVRQLDELDEVALVPHSNAGLYVAALAAQLSVRAVLFVDAGLPDDAGATPTAPAGFLRLLETLVDDRGLLPPWSQWWDSADVDDLFPDVPSRRAVVAEERRLPLAYFRSSVPSPPGWADLPCGYLAFGETYDGERRAASRRGWPVATMPGGHLQMLVDADAVAARIEDMVTALTRPGEPQKPT